MPHSTHPLCRYREPWEMKRGLVGVHKLTATPSKDDHLTVRR